MCYTNISDIEDNMDDISSTSSSINRRKTKLIEPRKIRKPLMEKKRRARINQSLDELKKIVVDAEKLNGQEISRVNKLEKADILEMTVRYLKRTASTPSGTDIYIAGFKQCIDQVQELISEQRINVRQQSGIRMVEHLQRRMEQLTTPNKYPTNNYINLSPKQTNFDINHIRMAEKSRHTDLDNTPGSMWRPW
ncbi:transcription factor HES-2-like [Daktulosphaira vitifoliae]|uniref:transcription factor HES-2-like n=1 Tax=Daktulosphaira vitifoliae TaxID=58002 RepID=UPI0021A9965A|nr:transcription factor HES-2-like [Daktulosphaira vitifoliae]